MLPHRRSSLLRLLSTSLIIAGAVLLALVAAYYAYSWYAQSQLDKLNRSYEVQASPLEPSPSATATAFPQITPTPAPQEAETPTIVPSSTATPTATATPVPPPSPALRVVISSIEVDSKVVELGQTYEEGELVWETPAHAVGHLKGTANPGEKGNVVLTGHISSPLKREGNVFRRLPELAQLLGSEVYVYTAEEVYRYRVVETKVVKPSEVSVIDPTPDSTLTLITCVPDWVYSHRLVVIAKPF